MTPIPLGCADFAFPLLPHNLVLDLIAGLSIKGVDVSLMLGSSHLDVEDALHRPAEVGKDLSKRVSNKGLVISDINFMPAQDFRTLAINHPDVQMRRESADWFRRAIDFAGYANARHMTILPGVLWPDEAPQTCFERSAAELAWRVAYAADAEIVLSIEAHLGAIISTPAETHRILKTVPGLSLTLDYTHFVYQGFADADCEPLLPHASHFHARGGKKGRLQTSLRQSSIDYATVLKQMRTLNYSGYFTIEYVWLDWEGCNEVDNLSETILLRDLANTYR
jgi:sugar phosphate isomerase/epimerase